MKILFETCFCYYHEQLLSALGLVLYEFDANKNGQVSLVVKYIIVLGLTSAAGFNDSHTTQGDLHLNLRH